MNALRHALWLAVGGLKAAGGYFLGGLLACATVVGFRYGVTAFETGLAILTPFDKVVVVRESRAAETSDGLNAVLDVVWILVIGWLIAAVHAVSALLFAITIVGMPFAREHWKLIPLALRPRQRELR